MKIAIFHLGFFYSGGGEKLVLEEMRGLREMGHEVDCYAPYIDRRECFPDIPEMADIKSLLPHPPRWLPMRDPIWVLISCILIPLMARKFRVYDVFLGANQPGPWFAFISSKLVGKPYVIYLAQALRLLHPREVDRENGIRIREGDHRFLMVLKNLAGPIVGWADRISTRNASVILTNGKHVSNWIREVYGVDDVVCPAGCHPTNQDQLDYESRWSGKVIVNDVAIPKPYILLSNRHSPQKLFEYALWALKNMARRGCRIPLVITGQETTYTDKLRYLAAGLRVEDLVYFVGLATEKDLGRLYREAALYVYPSPEEDFGMGVVEAMGAGTATVAWKNGGPAHTIVDNETGFLVEPYDTDEFAERMLLLATNPDLAERLGRAARERAELAYSYSKHNRIVEAALSAAVREKRIELPDIGTADQTHWQLDLTRPVHLGDPIRGLEHGKVMTTSEYQPITYTYEGEDEVPEQQEAYDIAKSQS